MKERKCRQLRNWLPLIIAILAFNSCLCEPEVIETEVVPVELQNPPIYPVLTWELTGNRFSLSEQDFDDLQEFFDAMDGYYQKIRIYSGEITPLP